MASAVPPAVADERQAWFIVSRWQQYDAESRANMLRAIGIGAFYAIELINVQGVRIGGLELPAVAGVAGDFHAAVTALAVAWTMLALGTQLCLRRHIFPAVLKYVTSTLDVVLLTAILAVADGPRSPLLIGYPLLVALAGLRFSLPLVRWTTAASAGGYIGLLGYVRWFSERDLAVPRYQQVTFLLGIVLTGVVVGQIVRQAHRMAEQFAARTSAVREDAS
jgi:hypothetical protein